MPALRRRFVFATVAAIALLDLAAGVYLLASPEPWLAHGPGTVWAGAPAASDPALVMSLFRRVGAFSVYAGTVSLVWLWLARRDRRLLSALLATYTVAGLAFSYADNAFFEGTRYLLVKQLIGAFWTAALFAHFLPGSQLGVEAAEETKHVG